MSNETETISEKTKAKTDDDVEEDTKLTQPHTEPSSTLDSLAISSENFSSSTTSTLTQSVSKLDNVLSQSKLESTNYLKVARVNLPKKTEVPTVKLAETARQVAQLKQTPKQKDREVEMFYFAATESPARKTLMKTKTEKFIKGFYKHLLANNASTPNPPEASVHSQVENHSAISQTLSKFYFSPDPTKESPATRKEEVKPPGAENESQVSEKPSFQYQHQNIFKTILRSKHFQTLKRTCDTCQNTKSNCACVLEPKMHTKHFEPIISVSRDTRNHVVKSENSTEQKPVESNAKNKSKLQKLMHEFYSPIVSHNDEIVSEKKAAIVEQTLSKNKTFNQIRSRTKEKFKKQMKEWGLNFNMGTSPAIALFDDDDEATMKSTNSINKNRRAQFEDAQKINIRLRSRVKKQLKQYETNSVAGTKKRRSKRIEWRPLVGDQIPKSSKQILQEISVIAKNKVVKKNPPTLNLKNARCDKLNSLEPNMKSKYSDFIDNNNKNKEEKLVWSHLSVLPPAGHNFSASSNLNNKRRVEMCPKISAENALSGRRLVVNNNTNKTNNRNNFIAAVIKQI